MQATNTHKKHRVPGLSGTCAGFCAAFFGKKPNQINDVPDVPGSSTTLLTCVRARTSTNTGANFLPPHGHTPRHIRHIRHIVVFYRKNGKKGGTVTGTNPKNPAQPAAGANPPPQTIRCTAQNAPEFQQMVKNDPALLALVQQLQAQDLFPGLRGFSLTLTGHAEQRALGVGAWAAAAPAAAPATTPNATPEAPTC